MKVELTAIIKKGESQYVSLCPEFDITSQGYTIEEAISNLKEACELYVEEMDWPEGLSTGNLIIANFGIETLYETPKTVRA